MKGHAEDHGVDAYGTLPSRQRAFDLIQKDTRIAFAVCAQSQPAAG